MKPSEVAAQLSDPNLLNDITYPRPREAVRRAADYMGDLAEIVEAAEFWLAAPHDGLRQRLMAHVIERVNAKGAS